LNCRTNSLNHGLRQLRIPSIQQVPKKVKLRPGGFFEIALFLRQPNRELQVSKRFIEVTNAATGET
jgi:hypothetical protein